MLRWLATEFGYRLVRRWLDRPRGAKQARAQARQTPGGNARRSAVDDFYGRRNDG